LPPPEESAPEETATLDEIAFEPVLVDESALPEAEVAEVIEAESESPLEPLVEPVEEAAAPAPVVKPEPVLEEQPGTPEDWREELSERVESFRRRRSRLRDAGDEESLQFDFETAEEPETPLAALPEAGEAAEAAIAETDADLVSESSVSVPLVDAVPLDKAESDSAAAELLEGEEIVVEAGEEGSRQGGVWLDSSQPLAPAIEPEPGPDLLPLAPIGRRFLAGLLDLLVLVAAAGLFAFIFWRAGGKMTLQPLNLAVLAVMVALVLLVYFGVFTALAGTTPGLLWLGLEIRNLDGEFPTPVEAFWRAFGYLVSTSAVMLGYVWALVDTEGFTWHDRISGTCVTLAEGEPSIVSLPHA
jgi:uncharacterized RDD family membrane protein YckC